MNFLRSYLGQYRVVPPEVAVSYCFRQTGVTAAHHIWLTHHRTQRTINTLDPRPEEAGPSLGRENMTNIVHIQENLKEGVFFNFLQTAKK